MWEKEDSTFSIVEVRLVRSPREYPLDFLRVDRHDCAWLPTLVNSIGKYDFHHLEPDVEEEEEETMRMSWKKIQQLLTRWDPFIHYSTWLRQLDLAMNDVVTAHKMLAMRLPERNILKDLRRILLAANEDIPSKHVETPGQRYNNLCTQFGKITLLGMSNPLLAVLNVVHLLKYWHMTYDADSLQASGSSSSQTTTNAGN